MTGETIGLYRGCFEQLAERSSFMSLLSHNGHRSKGKRGATGCGGLYLFRTLLFLPNCFRPTIASSGYGAIVTVLRRNIQ